MPEAHSGLTPDRPPLLADFSRFGDAALRATPVVLPDLFALRTFAGEFGTMLDR
jgi:hypothetical protein